MLSKNMHSCNHLLEFSCWLPFRQKLQFPNHFALALWLTKPQVVHKLFLHCTVTSTGSQKLYNDVQGHIPYFVKKYILTFDSNMLFVPYTLQNSLSDACLSRTFSTNALHLVLKHSLY